MVGRGPMILKAHGKGVEYGLAGAMVVQNAGFIIPHSQRQIGGAKAFWDVLYISRFLLTMPIPCKSNFLAFCEDSAGRVAECASRMDSCSHINLNEDRTPCCR